MLDIFIFCDYRGPIATTCSVKAKAQYKKQKNTKLKNPCI